VLLLLPPPEDPGADYLARRVFRKEGASDVDRYYLEAIFQQKLAQAPARLPLPEALRRVAEEPGAIVLLERASAGEARGIRLLAIAE
jgi:hypothetical protein